jgi:hypothetical protein
VIQAANVVAQWIALLSVAGFVNDDKNRRPANGREKAGELPNVRTVGTADQLRARIKKMYPGVSDEELDWFM